MVLYSANEVRSLLVGSTELNEDIRNEINKAIEIIAKLRNSVEKMAEMMRHVEQGNSQTNSSVEELAIIAPKIADAVSISVRSLQFEDMTHQSLESLQMNVSSLDEISEFLAKFEKINMWLSTSN